MSKKLQSLDEVIGQKSIVNWFKSCIERDKLPQVILLHGPTGIGKTSIAKIVACEIACVNNPDKLSATKQAVILDNKNTDCVRCYNMSNLKSQEAVNEVKSDLSVGFSSTGRKVIIMDEAHGMNEEAQDSLLTTFEALPLHVYVIICSTELSAFREAFLSRCIPRRLTNLSQTEMRALISKRIKENNLTFELPLNMVYALITTYTGREPRRAMVMLDSFETDSKVRTEELETFFNVYEGKQVLTLLNYLYTGDILRGLEFIAEMTDVNTLSNTLLEILRVAQNGQSNLLDSNMASHVRKLVSDYGMNSLLGFTIDCTTRANLTRSLLSGFFLKWCYRSEKILSPPERTTEEQVRLENIKQMSSMIEERVVHQNSSVTKGISLDALMSNGESV